MQSNLRGREITGRPPPCYKRRSTMKRRNAEPSHAQIASPSPCRASGGNVSRASAAVDPGYVLCGGGSNSRVLRRRRAEHRRVHLQPLRRPFRLLPARRTCGAGLGSDVRHRVLSTWIHLRAANAPPRSILTADSPPAWARRFVPNAADRRDQCGVTRSGRIAGARARSRASAGSAGPNRNRAARALFPSFLCGPVYHSGFG
jgi:hypothetical protein